MILTFFCNFFVTVFSPPVMSYLHHSLSKPSLLFTSSFLIYYLSKNEGYVLISPRTYFANKLLCTYGNKPRGIFCFKYGCVIVERFFSCHLERNFLLPSSFNQTAPEIFCTKSFNSPYLFNGLRLINFINSLLQNF